MMDGPDDVVLALDVGGTKVAGALVDGQGHIVGRARPPTVVHGRPDPEGAVTVAVVSELLRRADRASLTIRAVGAGYPEYVSRHGALTSREVLPDSYASPQHIRRLCPGVPVVIESDVRAGAAAEVAWGAGRGASSMLYVSIGTGVSTTFVVDGTLVPGHRGEALAMGELDVSRRGLEGCARALPDADVLNLEAFCSGAGITERYARHSGTRVDGAAEVLAHAFHDDLAKEIVVSAGIALGRALAGQVAVLDPERVVVGGGLGCATGLLADVLRDTFLAATKRRQAAPALLVAQTGVDGGLLGAAALAHAAVRQCRSES